MSRLRLPCVWLLLLPGTVAGLSAPADWCLERAARLAAEGLREAQLTVAALLGAALLLFAWHCHRVGSEGPSPPTEAAGRPAPASLAPERGPGPGPRLYGRLQEYAKRYSWAGMGRLHRAVRERGRRTAEGPAIQRPSLLFLPEVPSTPYFPRDAQRHDVEVLERHHRPILAEFERAHREMATSWSAQPSPAGSWLTFHLYRGGVCLPGNCRACPRTFRALSMLRTFINSNSFGNACFSLLTPGTFLAENYGPTNTRLRCQLGLKIPPGCELVVGGEPQCWSEGHCLLVDDSFLNTTAHNGAPDTGPRVIFMVDLWHPNIAAAERQALDYIFTPGR